jgi:DNA-binding NarL/FixJ family response regulator
MHSAHHFPATLDGHLRTAMHQLVATMQLSQLATEMRQLTLREQAVLAQFLLDGEAKVVADHLGTSEHTVRNQLATIREKLGICSLHQLAVRTILALVLSENLAGDSGNNYGQPKAAS